MVDPNATEYAGYHAFKGEPHNADNDHGSFEVFWHDEPEVGRGWFWHACFPGCLPDSDPVGPFDTSNAAYLDAQGY